MFALKLDFLAFASIRKTLNRALTKANGSRNIQIFPIVCYRSRGPTVISYWMKNESCVLYRSYPGQLVLSRGQAIWKSVPKSLDFFWLLI